MKLLGAEVADSEEDVLALERFLPFRMSVLGNRLTRMVARVYAQRYRLSAPEWRTLAVLGRYGATTANRVVEYTAMDKVRVSRAVAKLLTSGYITRHADPKDRRRAILGLTPAGAGIYREIVPLVLAVEEEIVTTLNPEEREALSRTLAKLEQHIAGRGEADIEADIEIA
jgi:DNA-binding MarR family transcriptional regulator